MNEEIIFSYDSYQVQLQIVALHITSQGRKTNKKNLLEITLINISVLNEHIILKYCKK